MGGPGGCYAYSPDWCRARLVRWIHSRRGADPTAIAGIALRAGQNGATAGAKTAHFVPFFPGLIIEANLANVATNHTSVATNVGTAYGLVKRTVGTTHWVIDVADTTATRCRVIGFAYPSVVGDINARVYAATFAVQSAFGG